MEEMKDLEINGRIYTIEELKKLGVKLASSWGGKFLYYELDNEKKEIVFVCDEFGEVFLTKVKYDGINHFIKS